MAFYRIKDAAEKIGVPAHVLRFWESQFPGLKPNKTGRGQRLFDDEDVKNFLKIKHLLYVEGYSIPGAKKYLKEEAHAPAGTTTATHAMGGVQKVLLNDFKKDLQKLIQFTREI
jgi:DNA-binding transcriptional MerR regulator